VKTVEASIEIAAPVERVWSVVSDLDSFRDWNPFMTQASGQLAEGGRLSITIEPPGGKTMTFKPTVLEVERPHRIRWLGRFLVPGLFDGEHLLQVEVLEGVGSRFTQSERFGGILTWFSGKLFDRTRVGFEAMNAALKERCEPSP
jgi:hypothetical protein